jgi:hypothetical protein
LSLAKHYRETPIADGNVTKLCIRLIATMNLCVCGVRRAGDSFELGRPRSWWRYSWRAFSAAPWPPFGT